MGNPTQSLDTPSLTIVFCMASKIFLYGNFPLESTFIFWILVLALSNGKLTNEERKPETKLALKLMNVLLKSDTQRFGSIESSHELFLHFVIGWKHGQVEDNCSDDGGSCSSPKCQNTLFFNNSRKGISNPRIISSLSRRQSTVSLHSH